MGSVLKQFTSSSINASRLYSTNVHITSCVHRCKLLVVGGGTGGSSVAWRFARKLKEREIIVLEPSEYHYSQPVFTLVAAGIKKIEHARRPMLHVLPSRACWFKDRVKHFEPDSCLVHTCCGDQIRYEYMVIALGIQNRYDMIPGLQEALDNPKSNVSTIYAPEYCTKTWDCLRSLQGGHAVFTYPALAGKCAGAAQKIMYLSEDYWRKKGRRGNVSITYNTGSNALFSIPKYEAALRKITKTRSIAVNCQADLVEVLPGHACFELRCDPPKRICLPYSFLHVTPPMCAPDALRRDPRLATEAGYLAVDDHTLQHTRYSNIFGLGDCTCTPNTKTAAAVGPQSQVVEENLTQVMRGKAPTAKYHGYGACPMLTSYRRGILAEFQYNKKVCETFPFDQSKENRFLYNLVTRCMPRVYWNKIIKGKWNGPRRLRRIINPFSRS